MTAVELYRAVTRGQQQTDTSAQLKSSLFLLEDKEPSKISQNQLPDPVVSLIMVAVESQSRPEWKKHIRYYLTYQTVETVGQTKHNQWHAVQKLGVQ